MKPSRDIQRLLDIMAALRAPESGCPWDLEQTFETIAPYTLEEAYEVVDAIQRGDFIDLKEELGDLLLQVVFHARMAEELNAFDFGEVVAAISGKLIRRHPHVFGEAGALSPDAVKTLWDEIKRDEKAERVRARAAMGEPAEKLAGVLDGVPVALPALTRSDKLTRKAAKVGFDWPDSAQVMAKVREELDEVAEAAVQGSRAAIEDEIGDLLFAVANLARHFDIDPESALRQANHKFERRFRAVETMLAERGTSPVESNLDDMERLWAEAKTAERANVGA
jgi:nucleoside triphosphate diphosphatase